MLWLFNPAIEILPFVVRYTCAFSVNALDCSGLIPVKLERENPIKKLVIFDQPPWSRSPEHANLIDDVVPVTRCLELLCQQPVQFLAHINDASGHCAHIPFPLLEQLGVVQYKCDLEPLG